MPKVILPISGATQSTATSCWATCGRLVSNYYGGKRTPYQTDDAFGKAVNLSTSSYQDTQAALNAPPIKCYSGQDNAANIPKLSEIADSIGKKQPLAVCVSAKPVTFPNNVKNGHYILIVGVDTDNALIYVMDPDPLVQAAVLPMAYSSTQYNIGHGIANQYWGATYYTENGTPSTK
jgi:hypothetical protein